MVEPANHDILARFTLTITKVMSARRPRPATSRPQTNPTSLALGSSTAGWYAEWKARKQAAVAVEPERGTFPADDRAEALAKWLTTDGK